MRTQPPACLTIRNATTISSLPATGCASAVRQRRPPTRHPMAKQYTPRSWPNLKGLKGISDGLLETHFALYQGYVKNTNALTEQLQAITKEGKTGGTNLAYAEMTRR